MDRNDALEYLAPLGVDAISHRVLRLLPLVYVAWADGKMENVERERIEHVAKEKFLLGPAGMAMLARWMEAPVPKEFVEQGIARLRMLAEGDPEPMLEAHELHDLLTYAEWIARATAGAVDDPKSVTPEEEAVLAELAEAFGLDNGTSWARLLADLGPTIMPPPMSRR
jgi:tellurite resistance protein